MKSVVPQSFRVEPNLRRFLSAGFALGFVGCVAATLASTVDGCSQRRDEIEILRAEVERLTERVGASNGRVTPDTLAGADLTTIVAPDVEAAATHLQATLRGLATTLGSAEIRVDSVRVLPTMTEGDATAVRASASVNAPGPQVFDLINTLESSTPSVLIESIRIVSRADNINGWGRSNFKLENAGAEITLALRVYARSESAMLRPSKPGEKRASRVERRP